MDPIALEKAFELYPEVKLVVIAHLCGTPGKMEELKAVCDRNGALIVEDTAESLGAKYKLNGSWVETGTLGDYNCISFNGNKNITGSAGGLFLTDSKEDADKVRKWSTQSREAAPWYQCLWASERDAMNEYGVSLTKIEDVADADCVIVAVAHNEFKALGLEKIKTFFKDAPDDQKVLIDVKGLYKIEELKESGMLWWRL